MFLFKEKQWYGYDAYDGAFQFFIFQSDCVIFMDSLGDCSTIFELKNNKIGATRVNWIATPELFLKEACKYMTLNDYRLFLEGDVPEDRFVEVEYSIGDKLFNPAFDAAWEVELACVLS